MDVNKIISERRLNEYIHWLEIALRAQVVCNAAFSRRFEEIKKYISTGANGHLATRGPRDAFRRKFDRLVDMVAAVSAKYRLPSINRIRSFLNSRL